MKPWENRIPDWFNLERYGAVNTREQWSYEVWVRSNYYQAGYPSEERAFFTRSLAEPGEVYCINLREIPVSIEGFTEFLNNNLFYWENFCDAKRFWWAELGDDAVRVPVFQEVLPESVIYDPSEMIETAVVLGLHQYWFEKVRPISINLWHSKEKIMHELLKFVEQQQEHQAGLYVAAGVVSSLKEMDTQIFKGAKILALFDLLYWRATGAKLTYADIGEAIWPGEGIKIEQRITAVGIPTMNRLFTPLMAKALYLDHVKELEKDLLVSTEV